MIGDIVDRAIRDDEDVGIDRIDLVAILANIVGCVLNVNVIRGGRWIEWLVVVVPSSEGSTGSGRKTPIEWRWQHWLCLPACCMLHAYARSLASGSHC